jgi:hypothetical protein
MESVSPSGTEIVVPESTTSVVPVRSMDCATHDRAQRWQDPSRPRTTLRTTARRYSEQHAWAWLPSRTTHHLNYGLERIPLPTRWASSPRPICRGVVLVVLIGAAASWGLGRIAGASAKAARELAVWGALAAFAVALVKGSLPMSVALVALAILVRADAGVDGRAKLLRTAAVVIGGGCGTGASVVGGRRAVAAGLGDALGIAPQR